MAGRVKRKALALTVALLLAACTSQPGLIGEPDDKEASRLNTQLGIDYMRNGRMDLAQKKLERAVEQDSSNALGHSTLAFVYSRKGDRERAERHYRRALSLDSDNPDTRNNFGIFLCGQGKRDEAERYFVQAAEDKRFNAPAAAYTNAGVCLRRDAPDRAEVYLRAALKIDPQFPDALAQMAYLSYSRGEYLRARAFLQRYEQVGRPLPETLWLGAMTERKLGDTVSADSYARQLRQKFPDADETYALDDSK